MPVSHPTSHLRLDAISKTFGGRRVLTAISFSVSAGRRVGLIGENGTGKSTLLRIAAGMIIPDAGTVSAPTRGGIEARIGLLHQVPPFAPCDTIQTALHAATAPVRAALTGLDLAGDAFAANPDSASAAENYALALDEAERLSVWSVESRVETMLAGLGLGDIERSRETHALSGGQRARLSLAWVLLNTPDVLLLDEPTNHLDDRACEFLVRTLEAWRGPTLFASHDRAFLDEAATSLIDLDPAPLPDHVTVDLAQDGPGSGIGVTTFTGSYTAYLASQRAIRLRWEQQFAEEQAELRRLRASLGKETVVGHAEWKPRTETRAAQKFYADRNARVVARRANDARVRMATLEGRAIRQPPAQLRFAGIPAQAGDAAAVPPPESAAPTSALLVSKLAVAGRLAPVSFEIEAGGKLLVTGSNGAGKSTLLRVLNGQLAAGSGCASIPAGLRVGLLDQEIVFDDPHGRGLGRTAKEAFADGVGVDRAERTPLHAFGLLASRDEDRPLETLSTGQLRRLALALLLAEPPDILLLDEPTNHLSLALAGELERALGDFDGTVIVASHDRWLRQRWQGQLLEVG